MKIELGESLCYSWLRHVKKCQLVQTNWKSSDNWLDKNKGNKELEDLYKKAIKYGGDNPITIDAPKNDNNVNKKEINVIEECLKYKEPNETVQEEENEKHPVWQFLKQAEIDVLGRDNTGKIYAIDVAFHENGLHYRDENKSVVKKLIRAAFCLRAYFGAKKGVIIFATPKINRTPQKKLDSYIDVVRNFIETEFKYEVDIIYNGQFYAKIMNPTIAASEETSDTSELFMRAYTLYNLCPDDIKELNFYTQKIKYQLKNRKILQWEIDRLKDKKHCKDEFGIDKPLLKDKEQIDYDKKIKKDLYLCKHYLCTSYLQNVRDILSKFDKWFNKVECINYFIQAVECKMKGKREKDINKCLKFFPDDNSTVNLFSTNSDIQYKQRINERDLYLNTDYIWENYEKLPEILHKFYNCMENKLKESVQKP